MKSFKLTLLVTALIASNSLIAAPTVKECVKRDVKHLKHKLELDQSQTRSVFEVIKSAFDHCKGKSKTEFKTCMQEQREDIRTALTAIFTDEQKAVFEELQSKAQPKKPCVPARKPNKQ